MTCSHLSVSTGFYPIYQDSRKVLDLQQNDDAAVKFSVLACSSTDYFLEIIDIHI